MDRPASDESLPLGDGQFAVALDRPETLESLQETILRRGSEGLAIYPQGGKTALDYGGIPRRAGVALDLTALNAVIDYPAADMTITIEPGITLGALQEVLGTENQRLPLDAPFADRASLGGIFATNTSGPRRFGAGRPRDLILGVTFVTADGKAVNGGGRVVKNVAGYDLPKLLTGSLGTLGPIAQMTLKVRPRPDDSAFAVVLLRDLNDVAEALERMNTSGTRPMALDLLNRQAMGRAEGLLDSTDSAFALAVGFEDNNPSVTWQLARIREEFPGREVVEMRDWRVHKLWEFLSGFQAMPLGPVSMVAAAPASALPTLLAGLDPGRWSLLAHSGSGVAHLHALGEWTLDAMAPALHAIREVAARHGGHAVLSRCPTEWKSRLKVWGPRRGDWAIMERIKATFDPSGVMNPGRFVGTI